MAVYVYAVVFACVIYYMQRIGMYMQACPHGQTQLTQLHSQDLDLLLCVHKHFIVFIAHVCFCGTPISKRLFQNIALFSFCKPITLLKHDQATNDIAKWRVLCYAAQCAVFLEP